MAKLQIKKSNETGKVPQPADLDWGELALNYTDGKLFYKKHGTNTVELLNPPDTNTVTRLRGTTSGTYTSGDLTLVAGTNITVTQSGSEYTIASAGGADSTKLPLAGGTLTGALNITDATQSTSTSTGALKVTGGVGIAKNLYVGGTLVDIGNTTTNPWSIQQTQTEAWKVLQVGTVSVSQAYLSPGHAVIGVNIYWDGNTWRRKEAGYANRISFGNGSTLWLTSPSSGSADSFVTDFSESLYIDGSGYVQVFNTQQSTSTTTGSFRVTGGVGVAKNLYVGGTLSVSLDANIYDLTIGRGAGAVSTNTAVGASALAANTSGAYNVAFGQSSLAANTTGNFNTAIAREALASNTTGVHNTSVGHDNLYGNTSGSYNTALGSWALQSNTTASNNTAVGYQAAYSNTTGEIAAFGHTAGYSNTTGTLNTAIGQSALYTNTTGARNTAVGRSALQLATTANNNTGAGFAALNATTTGASNTALGSYSLYSNTTASNNTAVGYQAGYSNTTGSVTAVGAGAGYANTTGQYNTYLGDLAGRTASTANSNTGIGFNALRFSTAGGHTAVGESALYANTTGTNSVAVGAGALQANTTASNNTAVGYQAGYSATTSARNVFIGKTAGYNTTTGGFNTFVGEEAGYLNTTGTYNTFVGPQGAGEAMTTGSKNTILGKYNGNQGGVDIRTANNYIVLSDGDGNPRIVVDGSGNTGIGNPAPTEKLDVAGNIKHTGLTMTAGTNVDQIYTHQQNITLTTGWQDTGVNAAELATGSYIVQVTNVQDHTVGGQQYEEYYTGVMSWFAGNTNSNMSDEIALHRAGHAPNSGTIFLRVLRTFSADTDDLKLQIAGTTNNTAAYQYTFKFRRLI